MNFIKDFKKRGILLFSLFFTASILFSTVLPSEVSAQQDQQDFGINEINQSTDLGGGNLIDIVTSIINTVLGLLGIIAVVLIIYGGFLIMTSGGNEEKVQKGKKTLMNAVIGLVIIMSSFAIAQFVLNSLSDATRGTTTQPSGVGAGGGGPQFQNFRNSGALGDVISDHYPNRGATGVKRNTKITASFNFDIEPSTILENTNDTCWDGNGAPTSSDSICDPNGDGNLDQPPYYGDCLQDGGSDNTFQWDQDCDQINTSSVQIYVTTNTPSNFVEAAGMTTYGAATGQDAAARQFVFRPISLLGERLNPVDYTVELTDEIKRNDEIQNGPNQGQNKDLFTGVQSSYEWGFQTDTNFDFDPPTVESVIPDEAQVDTQGNKSLETINKNSIIQINFSEPMDPTSVQGVINTSTNPFTNIIFNTTTIEGEWRVSNGYRTVEFVPSETCGTNSCGDPMYCLKINCPQDQNCTKNYRTLIRTAQLTNQQQSWSARPFSGVTDMAGNALDGNADGSRDGQPPRPNNHEELGDGQNNTPNELQADNFTWEYNVKNEIDRRIPYIREITPDVDQGNISSNMPVEIAFSMPMLYSTLDGIDMTEFTSTTVNTPNNDITITGTSTTLPMIWYRSVSVNTTTGVSSGTVTNLQHREFGPNDMDLYYTASVSSSVRGINQNCLYPGQGPDGQSGSCEVKRNKSGGIKSVSGCVIPSVNQTANPASSSDTGCPYNSGQNNTKGDLDECLQQLQNVKQQGL